MIGSRFLASFLAATVLQVTLPNVVAAQTTQASADEGAKARELFRQGAAAMKDGKFPEARKALLQVWTIRQSYDVAAVLGQAELELKAYRDAAEHLDFALKNLAPRESAETLANIKNGLATAKQHIAEVRLTVNEPNARITIDNTDAGVSPLSGSLYVAPGQHIIQAHLDTDRIAKQTIQASSGSTYTVELTVPPPPVSGPSAPGSGLGAAAPAPKQPADRIDTGPSLTPVFIGGGLAVVGAALGIGYRISASSHYDDLQTLKEKNGADGCKNGTALPADCSAQQTAADSVDSRRNISTVSFVVAGAAAVGTALYWFWPRSSAERAAAANFVVSGAPAPHGGSIVLSGSF